MSASAATESSQLNTPNAQAEVVVEASDLPLHCPMPGASLWNSHPRVFIPITESPDGKAECPYCGTRFTLKGTGSSGH